MTPEPDSLPPVPSEGAERQAGVHEARTHLSRLLARWRPAARWQSRAAADFCEVIAREEFEQLSVTVTHGRYAERMRVSHKGPFDRILIVQALIEGLTFVSNEARFDPSGGSRIW